ncbi:MAG: hypothetical protein HY958_10325 [Bacteroidia bacterium]|nr:hypothetical protein [Bacteroidia bacterium]
MRKIIIFILILFSAVIYSCKTDFKVNSEWKDITLVYGLLNQRDTAHYIKINKIFLGDRSAYEMAMISDSVNYSNAIVTLEEWKNNISTRIINFYKTTNEIIKDSGIFATDSNILYKSKATLNGESLYKLKILIGNKLIASQTNLIDSIYIQQPTTTTEQTVSFENYASPYKTKWTSAINGKIYELTLRFHYLEANKQTGVIITHDSIDWALPAVRSAGIEGSETMTLDIGCENFYRFIGGKLFPPDANVIRYVEKKSLDFIFTVGGDELNTYIEVSRPTEGLTMDKPAYTNIENGIGIFSCRYNQGIFGKRISEKTIDSLASGSFTKALGFKNSQFTISYWSSHP